MPIVPETRSAGVSREAGVCAANGGTSSPGKTRSPGGWLATFLARFISTVNDFGCGRIALFPATTVEIGRSSAA
jgi:hypothetical protein